LSRGNIITAMLDGVCHQLKKCFQFFLNVEMLLRTSDGSIKYMKQIECGWFSISSAVCIWDFMIWSGDGMEMVQVTPLTRTVVCSP